jgi:hypothetical protein
MTGPEILLAVMGAAFLVLGIVIYIRDNRNTSLKPKSRQWRWISLSRFSQPEAWRWDLRSSRRFCSSRAIGGRASAPTTRDPLVELR